MKKRTKRSGHLLGLKLIIFLMMAIPSTSSARLEQLASGSFRPILPSLRSEESPTIYYPKLGELQVRGVRYCGDGDVAHYSDQHKEVEFTPTDEPDIQVVLGYWVVPEDKVPPGTDVANDDLVPTGGSWYAVATQDLEVDGDYAKKFKMVNQGGKEELGFEAILNNGVNKAIANIQAAYANKKEYRVYAAVMGCNKLIDAGDPAASPSPRATQIVDSFLELAKDDKKFKNSLKSDPGGMGFDVTVVNNGQRYDVKVAKHGAYDASSDALYPLIKEIGDIEFPDEKNLSDHKKKLKSAKDSVKGALSSDCSGKYQTKKLWFEAVPMDIPCQVLQRGLEDDGDILSKKIDKLFEPGHLPKKNEFESARDELANHFRAAAILRQAMYTIDSDPTKYPRSLARCFDSNAYITKVLGSIVLPLKNDGGAQLMRQPEFEMVHPEPLYALVDFKEYHGPGGASVKGGDAKTVFEMSKGKVSSGLKVKGGETGSPVFVMPDLSGNFSITIKVRSIGCAQNIYCHNDYLQRVGTPL